MGPEPDLLIRLALVDDQTMFREGLRALLEQEPDVEVVAQASSVQALAELDVEPDVVVTDLALADTPLDQIVEQIRKRLPDAAIVALTALDDLSLFSRCSRRVPTDTS